MTSRNARARLYMLASASFMSTVGLFVRWMPVGIFVVAALRGIFGLAWITVFLAVTGRLGAIRPLLRRWKTALAFILSNSWTILFYFGAISLAGPSFAAFLLYLGPVISVVLFKVFLGEKVGRVVYIAYFLAVLGLLLIMEPWTTSWFSPALLLGLASAVCLGVLGYVKKWIYANLGGVSTGRGGYSGTCGDGKVVGNEMPGRNDCKVAGNGKTGDEGGRFGDLSVDDAAFGLTWVSTLGLAVSFSFSLLVEAGPVIQNLPGILLGGALLGLVPTALAFTLYNLGLRDDVGGNVIILSYAEPFVATLLGMAFFGIFSLPVVFGGALVIASNAIVLRARVS